MANKDEKTFADIFSSSTSEPEEKTETFSDLLNNKTEEEKENSSTITFDSIFDQISDTEPEAEKIAVNSFKLPELEDEKIEVAPIKEEQEVESENNNDIFSSKQDKAEIAVDAFNPFFEEKTIEKNDKITEETNFVNSPFFQSVDDKTRIPSIEESKLEPNSNNSKEIELSTEDSITNNPFFQHDDDSKSSLNDETSNNTKVELEDEINSKEEIAEEPNLNNNPFINDDSNNNENILDNPFFEEEDNNNEEKQKIEENASKEKATNEDKSSLLSITNDEDTSAKQEENITTSPFFQQEVTEEENPFFQNKINLVENQVPTAPSGNINLKKTKHYNVKIEKKKEPLIKFLFGVLSYALFILLLLIGITLLVYVLDIKIRAAKGDYSSPKFNAYVVLTGSMLPEIEVYDVVITKKVEAEKLNEGDVITFASNDSRFLGTIITHRIIKKNPATDKEGYTFQTKGDNNNVADNALVPENNIYGKVILKIPKLGYLQEFLASDGGWIIVILIPCLTVISYDIVKLAKGLKRKKYKNIKVQK